LIKIFLSTKYNNKIIEFIRSDIEDLGNSNPCNVQKTFWDYLKNIILYSSTIVYNYLIFIIVIVYCMYILLQNMQLNNVLSIYLQCTHIPFLIFSIVIFVYFIGKLMLKDSDTTMQQILISPDLEMFKKCIKIITILLSSVLTLFIIIAITVLITIGFIQLGNMKIPKLGTK